MSVWSSSGTGVPHQAKTADAKCAQRRARFRECAWNYRVAESDLDRGCFTLAAEDKCFFAWRRSTGRGKKNDNDGRQHGTSNGACHALFAEHRNNLQLGEREFHAKSLGNSSWCTIRQLGIEHGIGPSTAGARRKRGWVRDANASWAGGAHRAGRACARRADSTAGAFVRAAAHDKSGAGTAAHADSGGPATE